MTHEALVEYKTRFNEALNEAGKSIDRDLRLPSGRGVQLLMRTYALTRGLWQTAQHAEGLDGLGVGVLDKVDTSTFLCELAESVTECWRDALSWTRAARVWSREACNAESGRHSFCGYMNPLQLSEL